MARFWTSLPPSGGGRAEMTFHKLSRVLVASALFCVTAHASAATLRISSTSRVPVSGSAGSGACALVKQDTRDPYLSTLSQAIALLDDTADDLPVSRFRLLEPDYSNGTADSLGDFSVNRPMPFSAVA